MTYVLDSSILFDLEKGENNISDILVAKTGNEDTSSFYVTFINLFEFFLGLNARSPKNKARSIDFVKKFQVLNSTEETAKLLAELKLKYEKKGIVLSLADLIIASLAIENDSTVITSDTDFAKITELKKIII